MTRGVRSGPQRIGGGGCDLRGGILRGHDTGEAGGCQFLVMGFVDGFSLDRLVAKKGPLAVPMACAFTRHAALGLQHAAEKGMVIEAVRLVSKTGGKSGDWSAG